MRTPAILALLCCCLAIVFGDAGAAALPDVIGRIKPSVVAIGTYERTRSPAFVFRGTGFAIGDGRTIATNAHVLPELLDPARREQLAVMVPSGDPGEAERREAQVLRVDTEHDVALVRITGAPLPALALRQGDAREGTSVAFTGFPIGAALGLIPVTHRAIVSALPPLVLPSPTARQLDAPIVRRLGREVFRVIQLDGTAYPGNSGGPLYDAETGEVIGIINMVFVKNTKETLLSQPSGITFAVPSAFIRSLIEAPPPNR